MISKEVYLQGKGKLTKRERDIFWRIVRDAKSNAQIAEDLAINNSTIRDHLVRIFRKFSVPDRTTLAVAYWKYEGVVSEES